MKLEARAVAWQADHRTIIDGIDLTCEPGTVTGLLGPNGSGKTTLLHVLGGLRRPSAGQVLADETNLRTMPARQRARAIALVEQDSATHLDLTVGEVVELGRIPHRGRWQAAYDDRELIEGAMRLTDIDELADRHWATLSGGERQRTQLARAIVQQPEVLLLDEPTNHLDLGHQLDFLGRVRHLGLTTVAALHDLELAAAYCDRVAVLDRGRLVAAGPVADVLTPELIASVWGVDVTVEPHPSQHRPHVRWNQPLGEVAR